MSNLIKKSNELIWRGKFKQPLNNMPIITVEGGRITSEQKRELIFKMTQFASEIMQIWTMQRNLAVS